MAIEITAESIRAIRTQLGLTQDQLGKLLGVHFVTVSKWERDVVRPGDYQRALLTAFARVPRKVATGADAGDALATDGVSRAVYLLLKAAFKEA